MPRNSTATLFAADDPGRADSEETTVTPGVTRYECYWGYMLKGKKEALIASGLARPSWFPDGKERDGRGYTVRQKFLTVAGRKVHTRVPARGSCWVWIHYEEGEKRLEDHHRLQALRNAEVRNVYRGHVASLKARLTARYPGVRIVDVHVSTLHNSDIQQTIRFQATKDLLVTSGLADGRMFALGDLRCAVTKLGCGYYLSEDKPGCWELSIFTGEQTRDGPGMTKKGLRETTKLLKSIFAGDK